jgi:hypothetical protein
MVPIHRDHRTLTVARGLRETCSRAPRPLSPELRPEPARLQDDRRHVVFAVLGFLSPPANRGGLMTAMLLLFVVILTSAATSPDGSINRSRAMRGVRRRCVRVSCMFPGVASGVFFGLNLWFGARSRECRFRLLGRAVGWLGISGRTLVFY